MKTFKIRTRTVRTIRTGYFENLCIKHDLPQHRQEMNKYGQVRVSTGSKYGFLCVVTVSIEMIYINKYDKYGVLLINYINKKIFL